MRERERVRAREMSRERERERMRRILLTYFPISMEGTIFPIPKILRTSDKMRPSSIVSLVIALYKLDSLAWSSLLRRKVSYDSKGFSLHI